MGRRIAGRIDDAVALPTRENGPTHCGATQGWTATESGRMARSIMAMMLGAKVG